MKRLKSIYSGSVRMSLLLLLCAFLLVGAAWARYQLRYAQMFGYEVKDYSFIYLWHSYDEETATFQSQQGTWQAADGGATLDFCVSNGIAENYAQDDQRVQVRLLVSLGAQLAAEELSVWLNIPQTEQSVPGTARPIDVNSPVYSTFGDGWVITFCDEEGEEAGWILNGAQLSYLEGQIALENVEPQETALMQLQVIGDASV